MKLKITFLALFFYCLKLSAQVPATSFAASANGNTQNAPSPLQGCGPLVVTFLNTSSNSTSLSWNFGNGQTLSGLVSDPTVSSPTVVYTSGTYTVNLVASNASGPGSTINMIITVFQNPVSNFSASNLNACAGVPVSFTNTSTAGSAAISSWVWAFANGSPSSSIAQSPSPVVFSTASTNTVSLTVMDANGCQSTSSQTLTVNQPVASFSGSPLQACMPPLTTNFTSTSTGNIAAYQWNFGGGTGVSTAANPSATFSTMGSFNISLTVTDNFGCTGSITQNNYVKIIKPTPGFISANACFGSATNFTNTASGGQTYFYSFGDPASGANNVSTNGSPSHIFSAPGTYSVMQMVTNSSGCKDSLIQSVTVYPKLNAGFTADTLRACSLPFNVTFTDTTSGTNSWAWDADFLGFPQTVDGTTNPYTHTYTSEGNFSVSLIVTTPDGCQDTVVKSFLILVQRPIAAITSVSPTRGCFPLPVSASSATSQPGIGGPIVNYHWDFGVNPMPAPADIFDLSTTTANYTYQDTGDWIVTMVVTNTYGCKDTTTFTKVETGTVPHFDFDADVKEACFPMLENKFHYLNLDPSIYADSIAWFYGAPGSYGPPSSCSNPVMSGYSFTGQIPIGASYLDPVYKFQNRSLDTGFIMLRVVVGFNGCNDTLTKPDFLYIHPPAVNFTTYPTTICKYDNHTVTFTNTTKSDFLNTSWLWDFGDNLTDHTGTDESTIANPSYTFTSPGTFTTWLYANSTSSGQPTSYGPYGGYTFGNSLSCRDSFSTVINVSDFSASINASSSAGCAPFMPTFTGNSSDLIGPSGSANTWSWNFGDGNFSNVNPVTNTYNLPGAYISSLIATNAYGCTDTVYQNIQVSGQPVALFTASDTSGCLPFFATFTDQSTATGGSTITSWSWDFGDPSTTSDVSGLQNPSYTYFVAANAGSSLPVTLTVQDNSGCTSLPYTFNVEPTQPVASFTSQSVLCNGGTATFDGTTSLGVNLSYNWNFGNGATDINPISTNVYWVNNDTNFNVFLKVTDKNGCQDSSSHGIYISNPVANFTSANLSSFCPPVFAEFYDSSYSSGLYPITSWQYSFGDGSISSVFTNTSNADTVTNVYNAVGLYSISLSVTNSLGCTSGITKDSLIKVQGPTAAFHYNPLTGCVPAQATFYIDSMSNVASYSWFFGDLTTSTDITLPLQHNYISAGSFSPSLQVNDSLGCTIFIPSTQPINIIGPTADFSMVSNSTSAPSDVIFTLNNSANVTSYSWNFADGSTASNTSPVTHQYTAAGNYLPQLIVVENSGCTFTMTDTLLIFAQSPIVSNISAYPVPTKQDFTIDVTVDGIVENVFMNLYDFAGLNVITLGPVNLVQGQNFIKVPTGGLYPGIYFFKLGSSSEVLASGKIIIE